MEMLMAIMSREGREEGRKEGGLLAGWLIWWSREEERGKRG
jgi:hypothetical protein